MTLHDPRRVRMHLPTGDLVCFNKAHGPATLTTEEAAEVYNHVRLTPADTRAHGLVGGWRLLFTRFLGWLSELRNPVVCVLVGDR